MGSKRVYTTEGLNSHRYHPSPQMFPPCKAEHLSSLSNDCSFPSPQSLVIPVLSVSKSVSLHKLKSEHASSPEPSVGPYCSQDRDQIVPRGMHMASWSQFPPSPSFFRAFPVAQWQRIHLPSRRLRFNPCVWKIPWRRKWQPTPVFLPGKSHEQRSLAGYSPWGSKESDTIERTTLGKWFKLLIP